MPKKSRTPRLRVSKKSARLENPNGDAFAVPSLASPGDMTLRQLFGGVNPAMAPGTRHPAMAYGRFSAIHLMLAPEFMNRRNAAILNKSPRDIQKMAWDFQFAAIRHLLNDSRGTEKLVRLARAPAQRKIQIRQWTTLNWLGLFYKWS